MKSHHEFDLSIIIPLLNSANDLETSLKSISDNVRGNYQVVVVDGASNDNFREIIDRITLNNVLVLSEIDRGEYDAMNKGISLARGGFLLFLMAGDSILTHLNVRSIKNPVMVPAYLKAKNKVIRKKSRTLGLPNCHQGIIFPNDKNIHYDLKYKISSDYDFYLRHFPEIDPLYRKDLFSVCYDEGPSGTNFVKRDNEILEIILLNFGFLYWMRAKFYFTCKHIVKFFLRKIL